MHVCVHYFTNALLVLGEVQAVDGQSPRAQNSKKGVQWGAVGPKTQKWAIAPPQNQKQDCVVPKTRWRRPKNKMAVGFGFRLSFRSILSGRGDTIKKDGCSLVSRSRYFFRV